MTWGRYNTKHFLTLTPAGAESDLNVTANDEWRLARQKSPIFTAQTTRPIGRVV